MSIQQGNEIKELRGRIESLERKMNLLSPEKRIIAGKPEPEVERPALGKKKRG
jgi:hypothetical protein